jgi:amino acid transporter
MLSLLLVGGFWMAISTLLSDALPPAAYDGVIRHGGFPLSAAADAAFGAAGRVLIDVMALGAGFALLVGSSIAATRIIYVMGADGAISRRFSRVHPRFQVPWFAVSVALGFAAIVDLVLALCLGLGADISLWLVNLIGFFALVTYLVINVCNPLLCLRRARESYHWFANGVVPACGVVVVAYFLYKSFFETLWASDFRTGKSVVLTAVGLLAGTGISAWGLRRRRGTAGEAQDQRSAGDRLDARGSRERRR